MKALPNNAVEFMRSFPSYRHLVSEPDEGVVVVHQLISGARKSPHQGPHLFHEGAWYAVKSRTFETQTELPMEQPRKVNV